jgi:hypothetical protein
MFEDTDSAAIKRQGIIVCLLLKYSEGKKRSLSHQNSVLDFFSNIHEPLHRHLYFCTLEMTILMIGLQFKKKWFFLKLPFVCQIQYCLCIFLKFKYTFVCLHAYVVWNHSLQLPSCIWENLSRVTSYRLCRCLGTTYDVTLGNNSTYFSYFPWQWTEIWLK